jgi:hypothetical protein
VSTEGGAQVDPAILHRRVREAIRRAQELHERTRNTLRMSLALQATMTARRAAITPAALPDGALARIRLTPVPLDIVGFRLEGLVDGRPSQAMWDSTSEHVLHADEAVLTRAWLLSDLGTPVADDDRTCLASVTGPPHAVFLTLLQAFDEVSLADIDLPVPEV